MKIEIGTTLNAEQMKEHYPSIAIEMLDNANTKATLIADNRTDGDERVEIWEIDDWCLVAATNADPVWREQDHYEWDKCFHVDGDVVTGGNE